MNKFILIACLIGCATQLQAQFSKGTITFAGSAGYSSLTTKDTNSNVTVTQGTTDAVTFVPQVGYFFIDNFAGGAGITLKSSRFNDSNSPAYNSTTTFLFSPFVRYYFPPKIYGQLSVDFGSVTDKSVNGQGATNKTSYSASGWSLLAGYPILLGKVVAIEPQLGYSSLTQSANASNYSTDAGLFLRVGIQVYLSK
jgi:outer membrane protein